ncbi:MAG: SDR family NAD(P)-dependent oxidoreductase [Halioglobus sp.]|nr:SDR family NAD(P)-dependent oxidoreductase [Halioglobus sp.]
MTDKVAFITGASRGIGAESAVALARAGYRVAITARTLAEGSDSPLPAASGPPPRRWSARQRGIVPARGILDPIAGGRGAGRDGTLGGSTCCSTMPLPGTGT